MAPSSIGAGEHTPLLCDAPNPRLRESTDMAPPPQTEEVAHLEEDPLSENAARIRHIVRKVDWRLIPLLFVTYMLNFMDKTILSSASVFGLIDDTVSFSFSFSFVFFHLDRKYHVMDTS